MTRSKTWRCFHCDDVFTNPAHAAEHFGMDCNKEPGCIMAVRGGATHLLRRVRELEAQLDRHRAEDTDFDRAWHSMMAEHDAALRKAEEDGYDKGVADARGAA